MVLLACMTTRAPGSAGSVFASPDCLGTLEVRHPLSLSCRVAAGQRLTGDLSRPSSLSSTARSWRQTASFQLRRTASMALQTTLQRSGSAQRYGSGVPTAVA